MEYFIGEKFIKDYGTVHKNCDVKDIVPNVEYAAKAFIKRQLGTYFFDYLVTTYNAATLSVDEIALVDRIKWAVLWRAIAESSISLTYQLTNKGYQKQTGDNSEALELKEVQWMYNGYITKADYFQKELGDYLVANKALYSQFTNVLNTDSILKDDPYNANGTAFVEGIGLLII